MPTAGAQPLPPQRGQTPISAGGARPASGPGHTLVADPLGAIDVRDSLAPPRPPVEKSQTTLAGMAAEDMHARRPQRRGRGAVWASVAVIGVAGAAAGVFDYLRTDVAPPSPAVATASGAVTPPAR